MGFGFCEFCPPDFYCHIVPTIQNFSITKIFTNPVFQRPFTKVTIKIKKRGKTRASIQKKFVNPYLTITLAPISARL